MSARGENFQQRNVGTSNPRAYIYGASILLERVDHLDVKDMLATWV